jgi:hypothetical protein
MLLEKGAGPAGPGQRTTCQARSGFMKLLLPHPSAWCGERSASSCSALFSATSTRIACASAGNRHEPPSTERIPSNWPGSASISAVCLIASLPQDCAVPRSAIGLPSALFSLSLCNILEADLAAPVPFKLKVPSFLKSHHSPGAQALSLLPSRLIFFAGPSAARGGIRRKPGKNRKGCVHNYITIYARLNRDPKLQILPRRKRPSVN